MHAYFGGSRTDAPDQTPWYFAGWILQYAQWSAINSCEIEAYEFESEHAIQHYSDDHVVILL